MVARNKKGAQNALRRQVQESMAGFSEDVVNTFIDTRDIATLVMGLIQSLVLKLLDTRDPSVLMKDTDRLLDLQLPAFKRLGDSQ